MQDTLDKQIAAARQTLQNLIEQKEFQEGVKTGDFFKMVNENSPSFGSLFMVSKNERGFCLLILESGKHWAGTYEDAKDIFGFAGRESFEKVKLEFKEIPPFNKRKEIIAAIHSEGNNKIAAIKRVREFTLEQVAEAFPEFQFNMEYKTVGLADSKKLVETVKTNW